MGLKIGFGSTIRGWRLFLEVIKMVEMRLIGLIEAFSLLLLCFKKFYWNLWKYFNRVGNWLWKVFEGVEGWFLTSMMGLCWKFHWARLIRSKVIFRPFEVLSWGEDSLWKYSKELKIIFGSHQKSWKEVNWSHKSFILALTLFQETLFRPLEVLSWGWK